MGEPTRPTYIALVAGRPARVPTWVACESESEDGCTEEQWQALQEARRRAREVGCG